MARTCTICPHPKRKEIEVAHLERHSFSAIARNFGVSRDSIRRHVETHVSKEMAKAAEQKDVAAGSSLIERLLELNKISRAILADTYKAGERGLALKAIARLESQLELEARLIGEIKDTQVSVVNLQLNSTEADRIARAFLGAAPPAYIETSLSEESAEQAP